MLPDVQGLMFIRDGVGPDLVRPGEPRLAKRRKPDLEGPETRRVRRPVSLFRKALRPATS